MLHARFNCKATDEQSRDAWNITAVAEINRVGDARQRSYCWRFLSTRLCTYFHVTVSLDRVKCTRKMSELIAVLRVRHYTSRNNKVSFNGIVW